MADAKKTAEKKKPVSKSAANAVANLMKNRGNTTTSEPSQPTANANPVETDDDGDESQGA